MRLTMCSRGLARRTDVGRAHGRRATGPPRTCGTHRAGPTAPGRRGYPRRCRDRATHRRRAVRRQRAAMAGADDILLSRCQGPVLDVGCGQGRLVAELNARGIVALGVDLSRQAVNLAAARGACVLRRNVTDRLPLEGRWGTILLADGNIGIGGDVDTLEHVVFDDGAGHTSHPSRGRESAHEDCTDERPGEVSASRKSGLPGIPERLSFCGRERCRRSARFTRRREGRQT